jgi:hypothetical protein
MLACNAVIFGLEANTDKFANAPVSLAAFKTEVGT